MNVQTRINVSLQEALRETEERYVAANPRSKSRQDGSTPTSLRRILAGYPLTNR